MPGYRCPELAAVPAPNWLVGSLWPTGLLLPPAGPARGGVWLLPAALLPSSGGCGMQLWGPRSRAARPPLPTTPTQCDKRRGLLPHQSWWPGHRQPQPRFSAASTPVCQQHPPLQPAAQGCLAELTAPPSPPTLCLRPDGGPARGPCQWLFPECAPGQQAARGSGAPRPAPQTLPTKHPPWPRLHQPSPRQPRSAQSRRRGPSVPPQWGPLLRIAPS